MFIQPKVTLESGTVTLLDEVIGANFAIIAWGCNPQWGLNAGQIAQWRRWRALYPGGAGGADSSPAGQFCRRYPRRRYAKSPESWFAQHQTAMAVVRPDRFVATVAIPQTLGAKLDRLATTLHLAAADSSLLEKVA
jgi:3-(3-hydroxy-phenyl)propionate hydroxylase